MFKLFSLVCLLNIYSVEYAMAQNSQCASSTQPICDVIVSRFFYNPANRSCQSIGCSGCAQANFFTQNECTSCCAPSGPLLPLCFTPIGDPCNPASVPPAQPTFSFNARTNKCSQSGVRGCPLSDGGFYANLDDCEAATANC